MISLNVMKINKNVYYRMVDKVYDRALGKKGDFNIYVSSAMYSFMILNASYKTINYNYTPTILNHEVVINSSLKGDEFEC